MDKNFTTARMYWELSGKQGHSASLYSLGMLYFNGNGVEQDYAVAKQYFDDCVKDEHPDCMVALANYYRTGEYGLPQNLTQAHEL